MGIIKNKDIYDKAQGNPVKGLTKNLQALIEVEGQLVAQNKTLAESLSLIKKSNDGTEAQKLVETTNRLKKSTLELTSVQKERLTVSKQREKVLAKLITVESKQNETLERGKAQLRDKNKLLKANATLNSKVAGTEEKLLALNTKLRLERKKLNTETKKGQIRLKEINAELDRNNTKIKRNADALKKQKIGIGQYGQALKGLGAKMVGAFAAIQGLRGAFNVLKNVIGATAEGQLFLAKVTGATNVVMATLRDKLIDGWNALISFNDEVKDSRGFMEILSDAFFNFYSVRGKGFITFIKGVGSFFKGDFSDGIDGINDGFVAMTLGIEDATDKAKELAAEVKAAADFGAKIAKDELLLKLDRSRFAIQEAKDLEKIAELRVIAADKENFTAKQRVDAINKAIELTEKLRLTNVAFANKELSMQREVFLFNKDNISDEIELNKLVKEKNILSASGLKKVKLLTAELQTAKNQAAAEDAKAAKDAEKAALNLLAIAEKTAGKEGFESAKDPRLALEQVFADEKIRIGKEASQAGLDQAKADADAIIALEAEKQEAIKTIKDAAIDAAGQILADSISAGIDAEVAANQEANEAEAERNASQAEADKEILNQQLEDGLITETEFKDKSAAIDEDLRVKNEKLEKDSKTQSAIADKKKALFDVGIATAVGVAKAIPNLIQMGLAAALGAVQLAVVAARPIPKFAEGGKIGGKRHAEGGTLIEAEKDEFILSRSGYAGAEGISDLINKGLLKDSDIAMMKDSNSYSSNVLQLNGLIEKYDEHMSLTRETNKLLSKTVRTYERGGMVIFEDINGNVLKSLTKN